MYFAIYLIRSQTLWLQPYDIGTSCVNCSLDRIMTMFICYTVQGYEYMLRFGMIFNEMLPHSGEMWNSALVVKKSFVDKKSFVVLCFISTLGSYSLLCQTALSLFMVLREGVLNSVVNFYVLLSWKPQPYVVYEWMNESMPSRLKNIHIILSKYFCDLIKSSWLTRCSIRIFYLELGLLISYHHLCVGNSIYRHRGVCVFVKIISVINLDQF